LCKPKFPETRRKCRKRLQIFLLSLFLSLACLPMTRCVFHIHFLVSVFQRRGNVRLMCNLWLELSSDGNKSMLHQSGQVCADELKISANASQPHFLVAFFQSTNSAGLQEINNSCFCPSFLLCVLLFALQVCSQNFVRLKNSIYMLN